jgi:hypothetical protein
VLLSLLEAFGEAGFRVSSDMITMLDAVSIDRATGDALKRIANDKKVPIYSATKATGLVDLYDDSFSKISDKVYAGRAAPVAGSAFIFVSDASKFTAQGSIYLGRGTTAVEGPLSYGTTSRLDPDTGLPVTGIVSKSGGAYYMIVLDTGSETTKFHNLGESVILAQGGDRIIPVGTTVQTSQATAAEAVSFTTTATAKILDGETTVTRVPIIAAKDGVDGNVAKGAIVQLLGVPFQGRSYNASPLTNAKPDDTDEVLRERIKRAEQAKIKGTEAAILQAAIDVVSPDELKRVASANIKRSTGAEQTLVFDDGSGYEPIDSGIGLEQLLDQALGGEKEFQLLNTMIERATVKTLNEAPFQVIGGDTLTIEIIGYGTVTHTFQNSDFKIYNQADSFEIVSSINSNYNLPFVARTVNNGKGVALTPKDLHNITVTGGTANDGLAFPTTTVYTLRLYRNDEAVYQEGIKAAVESLSQAAWGNITNTYTFKISVDNTPTLNISITDTDFQKYGQSYVMNAATDLSIWVKVLNDKLPGVTATVSGDKIKFESNSGASSRASLKIYTDNTTYVGASMFGTNAVVEASGRSSDYSLNTKTGQLQWATAFDVGETATAGSKFTRAKVETGTLTTTLSLGSNKMYIWAVVDGATSLIPHAISGTSVTIAKNPGGYPAGSAKILATAGAFQDAKAGDYIICWKNVGETFLSDTNTGTFKVLDVEPVASPSFIVVDNYDATNQASAFALPSANRFVIVRSIEPVQIIEINPLTVTSPNLLRDTINAQIIGATASVVGGKVRIQSSSANEAESEILIPAITDNVAPLGIITGKYSAVSSHQGYAESDKQLGLGMPTFKLLSNQNGVLSQYIVDSSYLLNDGTQNDILQYLDWPSGYFINSAGSITSYPYAGPNSGATEQVDTYTIAGTKVNPVRKGLTWRGTYSGSQFNLTGGYTPAEKYTLRQGLGFDVSDSLAFIIDKDATIKAFVAPMARKVTISSALPTTTQFNLADAESNLALNNPATFRDFDFKNFKFWTRAKLSTQGMDFQAQDFGPSGSNQKISLQYPTAPDTDMTHSVSGGPVNSTNITLTSGAEEPNDTDATSAFTVKFMANAGNIDYYKYTYRVGTAPNFAMTPGSIVNIAAGSSLDPANTGTYKITTNISYPPTATSFTIERIKNTGASQEVGNALINTIYPYYSGIPFSAGGTLRLNTVYDQSINVGDVIGIYNSDVAEYELTSTVSLVPSTKSIDLQVLPSANIAGGAISTVRRVQLSGVGSWSGATSYIIDDLVVNAGNYYIAVAPSLNQVVTNPLYWKQVTGADYVTFYTTSTGHNLSANDRIKITDIPSLAPASFNTKLGNVTSYSRTGGTVTVNTSGGITWVTGESVNITSSTSGFQDIDGTWTLTGGGSGTFTFTQAGANYGSQTPTSTSSVWTVPFTVLNAPTATSFSHAHYIGSGGNGIGSTIATAGRVDQQPTATYGNIAKGLKNAGALTSYSLSATQADVKTYIDDNLSTYFTVVANTPAAAVDQNSAYHEDLSSVSLVISPVYGTMDRIVTFPYAVPFQKGAIINFILNSSTNNLRKDLDGSIWAENFQVMDVDGNNARVRSRRYSYPTETPLSINGSWTAANTGEAFGKAESFVYSSDTSATPASPAFTLKLPLSGLAQNDQAYLIPTTIDQVSRLLGRLANSGLSNVAEVVAANVQNNLQILTNTFGSEGGVQVAGGKANTHGSAITGAGQIKGEIGGFDIIKDLRKGIVPNTFVRAYNTTAQNKLVGLDATTQLQITNNVTYSKLLLNSGSGTFQTQRSATIPSGVNMKVEKHGKYACYSQVGGTAMDLLVQNYWDVSTSYSIGNKVIYSSGQAYICIQANTGQTPGTAPSYWTATAGGVREGDWVRINETDPLTARFLSKNQGIFQVVRVYGDAFWVENEEAVEQYVTSINTNSIKFYTYDSVMPGDKVSIASQVLGQSNSGIWTVSAWDDINNWPSATVLKLDALLTAQSNTTLGVEYPNVTIIEKNPISLIKKVIHSGPSVTGSDYSFIAVDSTELIDRVAASSGGGLESLSKLGMDESTHLGLDAYRYYNGLIAELYKVIYGDPVDPSYPGVRAAGTDIDIQPPLIRRIQTNIDIRVKSGVPFADVIDAVRSACAGYVNTLDVGEPVSLSAMVSTAQQVDGVVAITIVSTDPVSDSGLIKVLPQEVAKVINPDADIVVNIVAG